MICEIIVNTLKAISIY